MLPTLHAVCVCVRCTTMSMITYVHVACHLPILCIRRLPIPAYPLSSYPLSSYPLSPYLLLTVVVYDVTLVCLPSSCQLLLVILLLILLAGDIETNPGPRTPKYPCGECMKACTSYKGSQASILCDSCNSWFHTNCVGLSDIVLDSLGRCDLPWECYKCGIPNISTSLFDSFISNSSETSTSTSRSSCSSTSSIQPSSPLAASSPAKSDDFRIKTINNLRTVEINFQSLYAKREEFWCLLEATKPDIIFGCETWLNPSKTYGELFPPGFDLYRRDRKDSYGGVLLGIQSSLNSHQLNIKTDAEFIAAKIINRNQPIIVGALYRLPNNNQQQTDDLNQAILDTCKSTPGAAVWIGGDVNLPDIDWSNNSIVSHQYPIALNESFLQMLDIAGLEQIVDFPTRGDNTLDVILTNRPSLTNRCEGAPGLSDHDIVFTDIEVKAQRRKPVQHKILLWKRADFDAIRCRVKKWSDQYTTKHSTSTPVEQLANEMQQELENVVADLVPSKLSSTRGGQPWFNTQTKRAIRRKRRAFKKARRTNKDRHWARFRKLKRETQKTCRQAYNKYVYDIVNSEPGGNKKLGALVKSKRSDQLGVAPLKENGITHTDPKQKANVLNRQFTSVFTNDDGSAMPNLGSSPHPSVSNIKISINGVTKLLRNLKPFKATGPDGIPARLLRETAEEIAPAVTLLFQASLDQGTVPSSWKRANVVPIFKKGCRSAACNYRPISLTSILCKLCEHIIHCAVIRHLTEHNILSDAQHGFRKRRSCESQLIVTINDLAKGLDDKSQIDLILLDFEKAFDKVSHRRLLMKAEYYGVRGNILQWTADFLKDRKQQVLLEGQSSMESPVTSGVPQGSVLGPLLFLIYINDLPDHAINSTTRLFADDSVLYRRINSREDSKLLQDDLDALVDWETKWLMSFNASKCQLLRITNKRKAILSSYSIHGHELDLVDAAKYLGVYIDSKISFNTHVDAVAKKANSTRAFLSRNLSHCSRNIKETSYKTFVRPIAEYAASAWDPHTQRNIKKIEQIQRSSARFVTGNYDRTCSVTAMVQELQWSTLAARRCMSRLVMMYRIRYDLIDINWSQYLIPSTTRTRGHASRFLCPQCSSSIYSNSFFPRTTRDWNALKSDPATSASLVAFKTALRGNLTA